MCDVIVSYRFLYIELVSTSLSLYTLNGTTFESMHLWLGSLGNSSTARRPGYGVMAIATVRPSRRRLFTIVSIIRNVNGELIAKCAEMSAVELD